jgi:hypothetical protein
MRERLVGGLLVCVALLAPAIAGAQSGGSGSSGDAASFLGTGAAEDTGAAAGGETAASGDETGASGGDVDTAAFLRGEESSQPPIIAPPEEDPELQLVEERDKSYFLVGLRTHLTIIPDWLIEALGKLEMFPGVLGWALGPEFTYRRNGFDIIASVWWGSYSMEGFSREEGDGEGETEYIRSSLGLVWLTVDFLSGTDFYPWFGLTYGGGVGIGFTTGNVERQEAYLDGTGWHRCNGPGNPPSGSYCEVGGGHYGNVPYNDGFGSVWSAYPYLTATFGFRWKPLRNLVIGGPELRIGLPELFSVGVRVNYMF